MGPGKLWIPERIIVIRLCLAKAAPSSEIYSCLLEKGLKLLELFFFVFFLALLTMPPAWEAKRLTELSFSVSLSRNIIVFIHYCRVRTRWDHNMIVATFDLTLRYCLKDVPLHFLSDKCTEINPSSVKLDWALQLIEYNWIQYARKYIILRRINYN